MNRWLSLAGLALLVLIGCNKGSDTTAKPGTTTDPGKGGTAAPAMEHLGNKIEISGNPIRVEKGKATTIKITATRKDAEPHATGKDAVMYKVSWYQGDIKLEMDNADTPRSPATGLKMDPAIILAGKDSVEITITAAPDAARGMVGITAKGGAATPVTIYLDADVR
ncbi:hypothetical protein AYO44_10275 [Planctomycetaceae bacterium SCGC AG-212-F19]|nr:hypothetical protein AYO44_10275 [Planctomycetaceae bacterium SCGC AG-212-F19]